MTESLAIALKAVELYAATHPRPAHVTQKQAAEMAGKSGPTIRKMIKLGFFKLNSFGMIPIEQVDKAISG